MRRKKKKRRKSKTWWIPLKRCDRSVKRQSTAFTLGSVWSIVRPELAPGLRRRRIVLRSCLTSCMLGTTVCHTNSSIRSNEVLLLHHWLMAFFKYCIMRRTWF
ncbi:hypothetical protein EPR50_G00097940 [Perca flavescens]|uniref:Uncharacterized protein n=1 Tax=Perca flavescens TaxID=8167 RepID=A0A484D0R4_PERFV|nr:hypothetical protein EPR50_G00097940 [Perca flavescens]